MTKHTPGPWRWQGEDYRDDWGWQMLVGPEGEGLIVGEGPDSTPSPLLRAFTPLDPALCKTGFVAPEGSARPVHVYSQANARLIAAAPQMLAALQAIAGGFVPGGSNLVLAGDWHGFVTALQSIAQTAIAEATGETP